MTPEREFVQHLSALGVPIFTAKPASVDGEFTQRPHDWSSLTAGRNAERIGALAPGGALMGLMGGVVAVVDVDPRNGGDVDAVRAALDAIGTTVYGDVKTPGGGRHFYVTGHAELPSCHKLISFPGVDVQSFGSVAYLPGTLRPKYGGAGYTVVHDNLEALSDGEDPDGAEALAGWVAGHRPLASRKFTPSEPWSGTPPDTRQRKYLAGVLDRQRERITAMRADSGRNTAVYNAAMACGNFIAGAGMDEEAAVHNLLDAAKRCQLIRDDGERSVRASILSGIRNGKRRPRSVPEPRSKRTSPDSLSKRAPLDSRTKGMPAVQVGGDPLTALLEHVRAWHELDDLSHVLFALACAVSAHDEGEPLWGMIVGAPSSGKTETVRMLDTAADDRLDELTAAGLLSWSKGRSPKPVGILSRVGERAFVTVGDFSTVLAMSDRGARDMLFALLRRAYDGSVTRDLGNAPQPLRWEGRLTVLSAVTPVIDNYTAHADALGPRWLYLRMQEQDTQKRRRAARRSSRDQLEGNREKARALSSLIVDQARQRLPAIDLTDQIREALADVAVVVCAARGAVPREGYGRREVNGMAVVEEPHRLVAQLQALTRGALAIGVNPEAAVRLARRAALDTVPLARLAALETLAAGEGLTVAQVAVRARLHRQVARMALEDLREVRLSCCPVEDDADVDDVRELGNKRRDWQLTNDLGDLAAAVLADSGARTEPTRKVGTHPPTPQNNESH